MGANQRVSDAQTRKRGPPSVRAEIIPLLSPAFNKIPERVFLGFRTFAWAHEILGFQSKNKIRHYEWKRGVFSKVVLGF
jgi:hypothetical protein